MKPGSCGYFSEAGLWRPILHLTDLTPTGLEADGWQAPAKALDMKLDRGIYWPMKVSESVTGVDIDPEVRARYVSLVGTHGSDCL